MMLLISVHGNSLIGGFLGQKARQKRALDTLALLCRAAYLQR